jgi:hypothetical protein
MPHIHAKLIECTAATAHHVGYCGATARGGWLLFALFAFAGLSAALSFVALTEK